MNIQDSITLTIQQALKDLYQIEHQKIELQPTRKEFEGDVTLVVFPFVKEAKKSPDVIAQEIGQYIQEKVTEIQSFNSVKGFLNLALNDSVYISDFEKIKNNATYGFQPIDEQDAVMVEYSSPNTNKPLHLGHIRNNLLGYSVAEILKASGKKVIKTQIVNDRGIHICKSMLAWQKFGEGETPETSGLKGDKLVGKYYVAFDKAYKEQINELIAQGKDEETAKKEAPILLEAQEMLRKWEAGDAETVALWKKMNQWVYDGFEVTYKNLGVDFDFVDYESQTYLLGKDIVENGLAKGVLYKKEDGSIWCDLSAENMDDKLLLRGDGTSVYMTQDLGTAVKRHEDYAIKQLIYTVGNEQNHHFNVLFTILKKLGYDWADKLYHLSYGMVNLADGSRMKSREGTVVDADDLITEMTDVAEEKANEAGKLEGMNDADKQKTYKVVGLGALKYFILKVDPKKTIKFDPSETIDFNGNTGPFIQYTHARICSLLKKGTIQNMDYAQYQLEPIEKEILKLISEFPSIVQQAAENLSPALIANYVYDLVKTYNNFYQNVPIFKEENPIAVNFRLELSQLTGFVIKNGMQLLGIEVPERM